MKTLVTIILSLALTVAVSAQNTTDLKTKTLDGKVVKYFPGTEKVMETGFYKNGKKDGQWIRYNAYGKKINEAYFKDGLPTGTWIVWDDNGTKRFEMKYENGKRVGTWYMWDENANLVSQKEYQ